MTTIAVADNSAVVMWFVISLALQILFPTAAFAKVERIDFYETFQKADVVILGEVVATREETDGKVPCATVYTVSTMNVVKGNSFLIPGDIQIGRANGLELRKIYLLFLTYTDNALEEYEAIKERFSLPDQNEFDKTKTLALLQCNTVIPGLVFDPQRAFEVSSNFIVVYGLKPQLPAMVGIKPGGTATWLVDKEDLFRYLKLISTKR